MSPDILLTMEQVKVDIPLTLTYVLVDKTKQTHLKKYYLYITILKPVSS